MDPLAELTLKVVRHLSNHTRVQLKWVAPEAVHGLGQVYKLSDGSARIDICDNLPVATKLGILCHECSHLRHDFEWMAIATGEIRSGSVTATEAARASWRESLREKRAQAQAEEWIRYAEDHAWRYFSSSSTITEAKLKALLDWGK